MGVARSRRALLRSSLLYFAALGILIWSAAPFVWQISTSFKLHRALTSPTPSLFPQPPTLQHFRNVFVVKQFQLYVLNSIVVATATTLLCLALGSLAALALSRLRVRGRFGILGLILSVSMFPQIAIVGPLYLIASGLDLLDTYTVLVII